MDFSVDSKLLASGSDIWKLWTYLLEDGADGAAPEAPEDPNESILRGMRAHMRACVWHILWLTCCGWESCMRVRVAASIERGRAGRGSDGGAVS